MQINLSKAGVGLGTSGIGDNFARQRLMMAQKAGYVQSTPSPYSQPGTALKQYQQAAPGLTQAAQAAGAKGIPGLLRQGMMGRPPIAPNPMPQQAPLANYNSANAHSVGNPFGALGQPGAPLMPFNESRTPQPAPGRPGVTPPPGTVVGDRGGAAMPGLPQGGTFPNPVLNPPRGPFVGPVPPGAGSMGGGYGGMYPPGTIGNYGMLPGLRGILTGGSMR